MLFTSPVFLQIFLPLLCLLYFVVFHKLSFRNHLLLAASLLFYAWGEPEKILLLLLSICGNYFLAKHLLGSDRTPSVRKLAVTIGVIANLVVLGVFKYLTPVIFFADDLCHFHFKLPQIMLPLGISFYTFQIISYILDTYRHINEPQKDITKLALFISFFPQLVAGPIIKYHEIETELDHRNITVPDFAVGIKRFIIGLAKKVLLANTMACTADEIFGMPFERMDTPVAWIGAVCYSLQIYFDFSGYSDMAIGLGRMFGFHFCENFNFPYCSLSVKEFWRRWHISLSTWFKEYLYIPLGGNRCSFFRHNLNLLIVFFVTGIWHGAAFTFVLWGAVYGIMLVLENIFLGKILNRLPKIFCSLYTLFIVISAWVLFRAETVSGAFLYYKKMFVPCLNTKLSFDAFFAPSFWGLLLLAVFFAAPVKVLFPDKLEQFRNGNLKPVEIPVLLFLLILSIILISGNTYNPFIYFRF